MVQLRFYIPPMEHLFNIYGLLTNLHQNYDDHHRHHDLDDDVQARPDGSVFSCDRRGNQPRFSLTQVSSSKGYFFGVAILTHLKMMHTHFDLVDYSTFKVLMSQN